MTHISFNLWRTADTLFPHYLTHMHIHTYTGFSVRKMNYDSSRFFFSGRLFSFGWMLNFLRFPSRKNLIIGNKFEFNSRGIKSPPAQALSLASKNTVKELRNSNKRRKVHINKPGEEGLTQQYHGQREKRGKLWGKAGEMGVSAHVCYLMECYMCGYGYIRCLNVKLRASQAPQLKFIQA